MTPDLKLFFRQTYKYRVSKPSGRYESIDEVCGADTGQDLIEITKYEFQITIAVMQDAR